MDVGNASFFCTFWSVLRIYHGSIYKIIQRDLIFFVVVFLTVQFTSIYILSESQQLTFRKIRDTFYTKTKSIPMHFVLGFFVLLVVNRWRFLHRAIPSADTFSILLNSAISSDTERSRLMRRATVRYTIASFILNLRIVSFKMIKRFPTLQSVVNSGILLKNEEEILQKIEKRTLMTTYVIPLVWATNIINRARKEGLINNDCIVQDLLAELGKYRNMLGDLLCYDSVCIPLFYTQVVTLSMYSYFFATLIGQQACRENGVPLMEISISLIFASLQFTFYVGWLKVVEILINPFGEDDEDFGVDLMVDRNLKAAYIIVDYMRVKDSNHHIYDYPVSSKTEDETQALYGYSLRDNHIYCSLETGVETQTEDKYFQLYENVPVTTAPLQLQTPSKRSSSVDYVNVVNKNTPIDEEIYSEPVNTALQESSVYENVPIPYTPSLQLQTPPQSSSYVDNVHVIYMNTRTDEVNSSESDAGEMEENNIYENLQTAPKPLWLKTLPQSSSSVDYANIIYKSTTTDEEVYSEPVNRELQESSVYENVPIPYTPSLQLQTPPQSSSYVDNVNVIYMNTRTDEVNSSESDAGEMEENNIYESLQTAPRPLRLKTLPQSSSKVDYANLIYKSTTTDEEIYSEPVNRELQESSVYENVPIPSASSLQLQTLPQCSSTVDYANLIYESPPTDENIYSEPDARALKETNVTSKPKKQFKIFSLKKFKIKWKK